MKKLLKLIIVFFSLVPFASFAMWRADVENIEKYKIKLPKGLLEQTEEFYPGIGSGIEFSKNNKGMLEFWAISDRGPNFSYEDNDNKIISFSPKYCPKIVKISVNEETHLAKVTQFLDIKYNGKKISGINHHQDVKDEEIYNEFLEKVDSEFGLDTESISILPNGNFVIGDEYYPSINIVDHETGEITKRLTPGNGLPKILESRNFNRGFESLTVTPNGKIYAMLEGVLNIDDITRKNAKFIRMIEIDLSNEKTRTFAYKFEHEDFANSSKVKIGDITAIDNNTLLVIEQGETNFKKYKNVIYKIKLDNPTDISTLSLDRELEYLSLDELKNVKFLSKEPLIDVRELGWKEKKLEGITLIDNKTIAITNDNDFGVIGYHVKNVKCDNQQKRCKKLIPTINEESKETNLWVIRFKNPI